MQNDKETVTRHYTVDYLSIANRDIFVTEDGSYTTRYVYDAGGKRISAEFDYSPGTKRGEAGENLQSDIAVEIGKVFYRTSILGSTLFAVDKAGNLIAHAIYDPWGKPLTETYTDSNYSGLENLNNYTGYTYDLTLALYFAQNRFYDAELHRFTQEDAVKDGANWYLYCGSSPVLRVDWYGLLPWDSWDDFIHDLEHDNQGIVILLHWLYGGGKELNYVNNMSWSKYMTANAILTKKIQKIVRGYCEQIKCGETKYINETFAMEIENGEQIIGYQYLHGTNADVGGFNINGTISKDKNGNAVVSLRYTWNDIIDPNFMYVTDSKKAEFAKNIPFAHPTDYIIRISWDDESVLSANDSFTSGWLSGATWSQPTKKSNQQKGGRG